MGGFYMITIIVHKLPIANRWWGISKHDAIRGFWCSLPEPPYIGCVLPSLHHETAKIVLLTWTTSPELSQILAATVPPRTARHVRHGCLRL